MYQKLYPTTSYKQFPANIYFFAIAKKIIEIGDLNNSNKKILDYGCGEKIFTELLNRKDIINYDIKKEYTEVENYEKSFFDVVIFNHVLMYMTKEEILEELRKIKKINKDAQLILSLAKQNFLSKIAMYLQFKFDAHKDTISSYNSQTEIFFEYCEFIKKKNIFFMTDIFYLNLKTNFNLNHLINNFLNKYNKFIIYLFFLSILIVGINVVKDFGVSSDEFERRSLAFNNLNYIGNIISPELTEKIKGDKNYSNFDEYALNYYGGAIIDAPLAIIEIVLGIEDKKNQFLLKHYFNFIIFFLSLISFYKIINFRIKNWKIALIGTFFLFLSPRIFANSFYNNVDIIFMSFVIFSIHSGLNYLKDRRFLNIFIFAIFISISICIRIMGIILPALFIFIFILQFLYEKNIKQIFYEIILFVFLVCFFTILFWPFLWSSPIENFLYTFGKISNYIDCRCFTLYKGETLKVSEVPWHYSLNWMLITIPIQYLILFAIGFSITIFNNLNIFKINNIYKFIDVINFLIITGTISAVIFFNSTLYNGWRHLYFIYPCIIYFSILSIFLLKKKLNLNFLKTIYLFVFISMIYTVGWMYKYHPYQYAYFNKFAGKNVEEKFDVDYWGLSYKQNLEKLIKFDGTNRIKIFNSSSIKMFYPLLSLNEEDRSKFIIAEDLNDADYWITNYYIDKFIKKNKQELNNFKKIIDIKVDDYSINTVYKKIEK